MISTILNLTWFSNTYIIFKFSVINIELLISPSEPLKLICTGKKAVFAGVRLLISRW